jgi:putative transcriptional regulator
MPRFVGLLSISFLVLAGAAAWQPAASAEGDSLAGQFVVATPELEDPNFSRTVVFMTQHDETGAMGLVINRVVARGPLTRLLEAMGVDAGPRGGSEVRVYAGGPVGRDIGFVLHSRDYESAETVEVDDHVAMTPSLDVLKAIAAGDGPRESLVAFGYAGWGAGQLESEIAAGAWAIVPGDERLLFDDDDASKWQRAFARRGVEL